MPIKKKPKKSKKEMHENNDGEQNFSIEDISNMISFANSHVNYNPYFTKLYKTSEEQSLLYQIRTFKMKRLNKQDKIFEDLLKTFSLESVGKSENNFIENNELQ